MTNKTLLFVTAICSACAGTPATTTVPPVRATLDPIMESDVRRVMSVLAADSMGGRLTGSPGAWKAARFIAAEMKSIGLEPAGDSGYFQKVPFAVSSTGRRGVRLLESLAALDSLPPDERRPSYNIIGMIRGSDPVLRDEVVAFAAHYDGLGIGAAVNGDSIYNGADDDASGVTTVLEIARAMAKGPAPKRTVLFMTTTGEEEGILGTRWYVAHPVFPLSKMVAEMEVEMAGRPDSLAGGPGKLWMTGFDRSTMGSMLQGAGIPIVPDPYPKFRFFERSDNIVFARSGIPAHTLSSYNLHQDYHAPSDEISTIDFDHLTAAARAAAGAARLLADGPAPQWNPGGKPGQ